jgi:hypothetical protein
MEKEPVAASSFSSCFVTGNRAWQGFRARENEYHLLERSRPVEQSQSIQT